MSFPEISNVQAFGLLEEGAVLVTATRRLSRHMAGLYSRFQQEKERTIWETPVIMPLNSWLESFFLSVEEEEKSLLLTSEQEQTLWEEIISSAMSGHRFPGLSGMSETAAAAREIIVRYKLSWAELEYSPDNEIKAFVHWAEMFDQLCAGKNFLSQAGLPGFMTESLKKSLFRPPQTLILAGFHEFDPVQNDFLSALAGKNVDLYVLKHCAANTKACKVAFNEFKQEAGTAARWALNLVLENSEVKVGIVVPGLETLRSRIIRVFDHVFHPETIVESTEPENRLFNVSLGRPLGDYPLVRCAVVLLDLLGKDRWDIREIGVILSSPFIRGGRDEFPARASLDMQIRRGSQPWRSAGTVLEMAGQEGKPHHCPSLARIISRAGEIIPSRKKRQSPAGWAGLFSTLLKTAGWPDARGLNSFEYQTFQAFKEELSRLSRLEPVLEAVTYARALEKFKRLLGSRMFQPETGRAPIQILGLFEAAGLDFDHLWVMNLNADVLPAVSRPNPLLPVDLQRKHQTPGSSPGRELDLAASIMSSLSRSSKEIIYSYSTHEEDREILESPVLANVSPISPENIRLHESLDIFSLMAQNHLLTTISDDHGLPLAQSWLPGGARAFQDQALCPFKGYAAHRLRGATPEEPLFALTPMDRGNLVHKILMRVWQEINSREELEEMIRQGSLERLLDETASLTVREFRDQGHVLFTAEFMDLEQTRLKNLIRRWLDKELERSDFEILALEKTEYVQIDGIRIKTRMDRQDRLENGRFMVIDYKTGSVIDSVENLWMGDRITEPQLPIYSQVAGEKTFGVVLAQVNPRALKFHGITGGDEIRFRGNSLKTPEDLDMPGMKEILEQWHWRLETISREIKEGLAVIDPLPQSGDRTCRYCDFMPLCRIREQG